MNEHEKLECSQVTTRIFELLMDLKRKGNSMASDVVVNVNTERDGKCFGVSICFAEEPRRSQLGRLLVAPEVDSKETEK